MPDQSTASTRWWIRWLPRATEKRAPSNPDCNGSYSFHQVPRAYPREESEPEPKASQKIETIGGTRRSRKPTMPSFSILRRRLPPPLQSTGTVYTHLTVNSYRDDRSEHGQSSEGNKSEATLRTRSLTDTPQTKPEPLTALKWRTQADGLFEKSKRRSRPQPPIPFWFEGWGAPGAKDVAEADQR